MTCIWHSPLDLFLRDILVGPITGKSRIRERKVALTILPVLVGRLKRGSSRCETLPRRWILDQPPMRMMTGRDCAHTTIASTFRLRCCRLHGAADDVGRRAGKAP